MRRRPANELSDFQVDYIASILQNIDSNDPTLRDMAHNSIKEIARDWDREYKFRTKTVAALLDALAGRNNPDVLGVVVQIALRNGLWGDERVSAAARRCIMTLLAADRSASAGNILLRPANDPPSNLMRAATNSEIASDLLRPAVSSDDPPNDP